jgi:putative peptidoglycan lipid II flippase
VDKNREEMLKFLKNMFSLLLYFILTFSLLAEIFMPQIVGVVVSGFSTDVEKYKLTVVLSRITFPYIILISLTSFMSGILHSHGKFLIVALNPIILNLVFILTSALSPLFSLDISQLLAQAVLIGGFLQFLSVFLAVTGRKIVLYPGKVKIDQTTKKFAKNFSSALLSSGIDQINSIISSIMLSKTAGAISLVYYADRLVQLPSSLIGTALGISLLPLLSRKIRQNDGDRFRLQENALLTALFLGLPAMFYLYKLSYIFVPVLFERGEFTGASSMAVVRCTKIYACALPVFILSKVLQSIFFSNGDTKTPMISALISLFSNIALALILRKYFGYEGVLISSALSAYLDFISLLVILLIRKRLILSERFLLIFVKIVYALVFLILSAAICSKFVPMGQTLTSRLLKLTITAFLSGIVYLTISYLIGIVSLKKYAPTNL